MNDLPRAHWDETVCAFICYNFKNSKDVTNPLSISSTLRQLFMHSEMLSSQLNIHNETEIKRGFIFDQEACPRIGA